MIALLVNLVLKNVSLMLLIDLSHMMTVLFVLVPPIALLDLLNLFDPRKSG